jgi:2'-5' RNA ligase
MSTPALRLFIAVELTPELRQAIGRVQAELRGQLPPRVVRWTDPDGIHLTLKFLGDTPGEKTPAIVQAMTAAAAGFAPCTLAVAGLGCFPSPRQPRVLWVGVPAVPKALTGVQRALDLHLARLNYPRETRAFSPHLTLGRVNDRATADERQTLSALLGRMQIAELGQLPVQELVLFQSDLRPQGAIYTALARAPLLALS